MNESADRHANEDGVSRRNLLRGGVALPVGVGLGALGVSTPAHAWLPVAISVVQMGVQLHGMMRKQGPGLAQLMHAQTRMLIEIANQIGVMNQKIDSLLARMAELRDLVERLPENTSRTVWQNRLKGVLTLSAEKFRAYNQRASRYGRVSALTLFRPDFIELLRELQIVRSTLLIDPSPLVIPTICTAWYVELRIHFLILSPGEVIRAAAESYREGLRSRTQTGELGSLIDDIAALKRQMMADFVVAPPAGEQPGVPALQARETFTCARRVDLDDDSRTSTSGGIERSGETRYYRSWRGRAEIATATEVSDENDSDRVQRNAMAAVNVRTIELMGIDVDPVFAAEAWPTYRLAVRRDNFDEETMSYVGPPEDRADWTRYVRRIRAFDTCRTGGGSPEGVRAGAQAKRNELELVRSKAFTAYSMLAACQETLRGIDWVLEQPGIG